MDIPAHISYHFFKSDSSLGVAGRIEETIRAVGLPVLEAAMSTALCVSSLFFVELHTARSFAKTMVLVTTLGVLHGLVVIPVALNILHHIPIPRRLASLLFDQRLQREAVSVSDNCGVFQRHDKRQLHDLLGDSVKHCFYSQVH